MCGLAGFARAPDAPYFDLATVIAEDLILRMEKRGRHATGIAGVGPTRRFLRKWAVPVSRIVETEAWAETIEAVPEDTQYLMLHVRRATASLGNKDSDEAAHPYSFSKGRTIGCHNGIVRNWRDLAEDGEITNPITDSFAALHLLDGAVDPCEVLESFTGDWAFTWVRDGAFHVARNSGRPLALAYVPEMRTLFWASVKSDLVRTIREAGVDTDDFQAWEAKVGRLYTYRSEGFDEESTNAERAELKLPRPKVVTNKKGQRGWDWNQTGRSYKAPSGRGKHAKKNGDGPLAEYLQKLVARIEDLEGRVESLEAENEYLHDTLANLGVFDGRGIGGECGTCHRSDVELFESTEGMVCGPCIFTP